jgi:RNA polymerase sigma factor (sigma-70 family)
MIDDRLVRRLHREAKGERWRVPVERFAEALEASAERAFSGRVPASRELERYVRGLHLGDLALACACGSGDEDAWGHFVLEHRPLLRRAADALDPSGGAREIADSLYADLFGLRNRPGDLSRPPSLFRYFHGRSSLATWLRAMLAERHVDARAGRRVEPLPEDDSTTALAAPDELADPDRERCVGLMRNALAVAVTLLTSRERLRLACYYAEGLTLAQTGRVLGEHEATVSRQLAHTRGRIRDEVERQLRTADGLGKAEIAECFASVTEDVGPLDVRDLLGPPPERKAFELDRSNEGRTP